MNFKRYAIYFTLPDGPLADFGKAWLGWDIVSGAPVPHPAISDLAIEIDAITAGARRYGLHATIKPPFRLASRCDAGSLNAALSDFCARTAPVQLKALHLTQMGRFLALLPSGDLRALNTLAAQVVEHFDPYRAPLSSEEIAKRRKNGLSPDQDAMLLRWGYPYVMDFFRFHITLTDRLAPVHLELVHPAIERAIQAELTKPMIIDGLSLVVEDNTGFFHLIEKHSLLSGHGDVDRSQG